MSKLKYLIIAVIFIITNTYIFSYATEGNKSNTKKSSIQVLYKTHVQDIGWQDWKKDGELAGTTGQAKRLEGINIKLDNNEENLSVFYQVHVQDIGWQEWKKNGEMAGTSGRSLRLEGIKMDLGNSNKYSIMYRVHVQDIGWQDWKIDGELAGTEGQAKRLEAIEIKITDKDNSANIQYQMHIQDIGWQSWKKDGEMAGTSGRSLRVEAIRIKANNLPNNVKIKYKAHVQDIGWQSWKNSGELAGTEGQAKRLETIKIKLEGTDEYSVMYRAHVQDIGWQEWCYDGEACGTFGKGLRIEAIQIKIVPKITQTKVRIQIDRPVNQIQNTVNNIKGWVMTNIQNTSIKIYIDDDEIDTNNLKRTERNDVLNAIKGYGDEDIFNSKPGYSLDYDFSNCSLGDHIIKVQAIHDGNVVGENTAQFTLRKPIEYSTGTYGSTGLKVAGDSRGTQLKYYKYGTGPNVFYGVFAIHGWEDKWARDGSELTTIANNFYNTLINSKDYDLSEKWTIYLFPGVNLDGINYGYTHDGPGRTSLYSQAPNHKGIDMNRCWQIGSTYKLATSDRNYNGTSGFQAYEAQYLRNFLLNNKSSTGQTVLVDLHGWEQSLIGDTTVCEYYNRYFSENTKKYERYGSGSGYLIEWARSSLGNNYNSTAKAALIELPTTGINNHQDVVNKNLSGRYIQATMEMLREMTSNRKRLNNSMKLDSEIFETQTEFDGRKVSVVKPSIKYKVAFAGMVKNDLPNMDEIDKILEKNSPEKEGIWIELNSRNKVEELLNNTTKLNSKYFINEEGYLTIIDKNNQSELDKKLESVINSNQSNALTVSSTCYIVDNVTGEIIDYDFEFMDEFEPYDYFENENKKIIFITENKEKQLSNDEIIESVVNLLGHNNQSVEK